MLCLIMGAMLPLARAQQSSMIASLDNANLDVLLEPTWEQDYQVRFRVSFLNSGSDSVKQHIDYSFLIQDTEGVTVFNAGAATGQPTLHTAEGVVTIPYNFKHNGNGDYN